MAKRKTYFEQIPVETVRTIIEKFAAEQIAASLAAKPAVAVGSERKRA